MVVQNQQVGQVGPDGHAIHVKKCIQAASHLFPCQELWFCQEANTFWAFKVEGDRLIFTDGAFINGRVEFDSSDRYLQNDESIDDVVESMIDVKREEGYECFAIAV